MARSATRGQEIGTLFSALQRRAAHYSVRAAPAPPTTRTAVGVRCHDTAVSGSAWSEASAYLLDIAVSGPAWSECL